MDDKTKVAIAGFNFGLMGYVLIRYIPTLFSNRTVDFSWMFTQVMIGVVIGLVTGAIAFFAFRGK